MTRKDAEITDTRRQMLLNLRQGRDLYDGFTGAQYGGAIRSVQTWRGVGKLIVWDQKYEQLKLTETGIRALEQWAGPGTPPAGGEVTTT